VKILYFAWLRERIGAAEEELPLPAGVATVGALMAHLATRSPAHAEALDVAKGVRCAVNLDFAGPQDSVADGDEVAFFPPVTGG
jgi:molybdopterin converting factor subunit 1